MLGYLIVVLVAIGAALWYVIHCALFPYAACSRCEGNGKFRSSSGRAWRRCRKCKGGGERVRIGRRVYDWVKQRRDAGRG